MNFLRKIVKQTLSNTICTSTNGLFTQFDEEFMNENIESLLIPEYNHFLQVSSLLVTFLFLFS